MQPLRVGFLSSLNYLDKNTFSGTVYYMYSTLKSRDIELIEFGNNRKHSRYKKFNKVISFFSSKSLDRQDINLFTKEVQKQLNQTHLDVIFAPIASAELFKIETNVPIIFLSDATPILIDKSYDDFPNKKELAIANKIELAAISKASKLVYSSEWAAKSAVDEYKSHPSKIEVIPFGANLDNVPLIEEILKKCYNSSRCRLLFIGKDWKRKGGNIAFETLICLLNLGIDAELCVVGCIPPHEIKHKRLTVIPFLDKNNPDEHEELNELLSQSHFFILPTRADCSPIVLSEANAFGMPAIATEVGGIPTIISNGKNGYMLPLSASGYDYAKLIAEKFRDRATYKKLVRSSREEYDTRLNWNKWAESIHDVMMNLK